MQQVPKIPKDTFIEPIIVRYGDALIIKLRVVNVDGTPMDLSGHHLEFRGQGGEFSVSMDSRVRPESFVIPSPRDGYVFIKVSTTDTIVVTSPSKASWELRAIDTQGNSYTVAHGRIAFIRPLQG